MFTKWVVAVLFMFSWQALANPVLPVTIKGYREWKTDKIQTAATQVLNLKGQILKAKADGNRKNADSLEKQLTQTQFNLDVVRDLSVTDYFVLYLSQQSLSDRFQQAAAKMSTPEVAELMEAFANTLGSPTPTEAAARQALASPNQFQKLPLNAVQTRESFK